MIVLSLRDKSVEKLSVRASMLAKALPVECIGPYAPVNDRIGGEYVRSIRILLPRGKQLNVKKQAIYKVVREFEASKRCNVAIDVDPV